MKKNVLLLLLCIGLILAFTACGGSGGSNESDAGESGTSPVEEKSADVQLVDSGYSMSDDSYMKYGFIIENPSDNNTAYELPKVIITAYDKNGDVLATEEQVMNKIQPGEKQAFGSIVDCNGGKPEKVEFEVESGNKISPSDEAIKSSDLDISGTKERKGEFGEISVTGKVKNNSQSDTESVGVTVLFKKGGKIVLGTTTYVDNLKAGQTKAFEVSEYDVPKHDEYEVTAHDWDF